MPKYPSTKECRMTKHEGEQVKTSSGFAGRTSFSAQPRRPQVNFESTFGFQVSFVLPPSLRYGATSGYFVIRHSRIAALEPSRPGHTL